MNSYYGDINGADILLYYIYYIKKLECLHNIESIVPKIEYEELYAYIDITIHLSPDTFPGKKTVARKLTLLFNPKFK